MPTPRFDMTINLGHVLIVVGMMSSVFLAYTSVQVRLQDHETRLTTVERDGARDAEFQRQILQTLTTIREDIATLKAENRNRRFP